MVNGRSETCIQNNGRCDTFSQNNVGACGNGGVSNNAATLDTPTYDPEVQYSLCSLTDRC